ncbi:poly(A) polymerase [Gemmobacter lanyuensis]|uniref:Poly(A) polymerase n=1 Tax=Gemmobacter lanyuensis TaxID=1054497 RepID=A0A918IRL2_9RHOB|nr:CCA tRNA nucleotidyltransferase [Gemmobacter lanyuensis]GGW25603.1 poly(A) polymerase [Gemmobacter lanyuensis]
MKITGAWIDNPVTQAVCAALTGAGVQALFVGGCVRNALLGVPVSDIDIATDARPEIVSDIAKNAGFKVVPTGIDHGTVTVIADGLPHEITTFRTDVKTDGRRAVVAFSTRIEEDAARRDFTMNALYAAPDGTVIDPLGGLPDLLARRLRFVGLAEQRIQEDYLRILRFFRFHAIYGDPDQGIDAEGLAACAAFSAGIETLSAERIGAEMRKLLAAADPAPSLAAMAQSGVLAQVLPGGDPRAVAPLVHLEAGRPPRWQRRLAALGGPDITDRWRLSRQESRNISHIRDALEHLQSPAVLGYRLGPELAVDVILLRAALFESPLPPHWAAEVARGAAAECPVRSADLMPGLKGAALGARLKELEGRWLASDLRLGRADLLG